MSEELCDEPTNINLTLKDKHRCELHSPDKAYGVAVNYCYEDEVGKLWVGNIEYESQVNYCPVCGYKALMSI
ncbi:MAG: hypothetical protein AB9846_00065 [Tenuifilaceae bacterium]